MTIGKVCAWMSGALLSFATASAAQEAPKVAVTFGYESLRVDSNPCAGCAWSWYQYGFNIDAAYRLTPQWAVVGEFGWARHPFREDPTLHAGGLNAISTGGGLRWTSWSSERLNPFAQVIAGYHRDSFTGNDAPGLLTFTGTGIPANSFTVTPSGGVYMPLTEAWGFVGQVGYRRVFSDTAINGVRVIAGVRINGR
jgi:hypothetical protein